MQRLYASYDDARDAFDAFARLEPQLDALWDQCRCAVPPAQRAEPLDDAYDVDPFEADELAADSPDDARCAEDYFLHNVKSKLLVLVGAHRVRGPQELQTAKAYETVYDLLVNWALRCECGSCAGHADAAPWRAGDDGTPAYA
jgi:hypothetical protein